MNALQFSLFKTSFRLFSPGALWLIGVALLMFILITSVALGRRRALERMFAAPTRQTAIPGASPLRHWTRWCLAVLALCAFAIALARPQFGTHSELSKRYGIDLVIAIDASRSMLARDIKPNRLDRAKLELTDLLDKLKGDRVGLVVFAGDAFTQCPLTSDYAAAKLFLKAVDVANMPVQGTDIARALEESKDLLVNAERGAKARVVVLLTDGEETMNSDVAAQVQGLREMGVKVLTVGIGSTAGEPIPELDRRGNFVGYKKDRAGNTVMTRLDEAGLTALAEQTGGVYVRSLDGSAGIQRVFEIIDGLDKAEMESRMSVQYEERFVPFVLLGVLLLLASAAIRPGRETKARGER